MVKTLLFCHFIFSLSICFAQDQLHFYSISLRDGLASGSVTSIVQDHQGLIWVGTKKGLNRYDGSEFIHYHTGNSEITSNDISKLLIDDSGHLWIGTIGSGLYLMKSGTKEVLPYEQTNLGQNIISLITISDSSILVLSDKGLAKIDAHLNITNNFLSTDRIANASSVLEHKGVIWIGTTNGELHSVDKNSASASYSLEVETPGLSIQKIYALDNERLFIGTRQNGLWIFNLSDKSFTKTPIEALDIRDIIRDKSGTFWVGTDGHGIFSWDGTEWKNHKEKTTQKNSLASNSVQTCFEDRDGSIWFGSAWDGISLIDRRFENFQFIYSDFEGTEPSGVLSIYKEDKQLWLGTDGAGLSLDKQGSNRNDILGRIPSNAYIHFINKIDNKHWLGTFHSGFFLMDDTNNGQVSHFTTRNGLSHDDVRDVEQIDDNLFLIATWGGGLNLFDEKTEIIQNLHIENGNPKDVVILNRISQDEILVGTFGQGLFIFRPSDLSVSRILKHIHNIVSICSAENGFWVGTWGEGLHFTQYPFLSSGLIIGDHLSANTNILSVLPDNENLWLATGEQILRVSSDSAIMEMSFPHQNYHINSSYKDNSGRLFFGGTEGVISFLPEEIAVPNNKDIQILDVKAFNYSLDDIQKSFSDTNLTELRHDQNVLTFTYTTPTYPSARYETYEVMLKPIHNDWINVGHQRTMTFADLKSGEYIFSVRNASSKSNNSFHFRILRPWWKTWWAYSLVSIAFIALLSVFKRYSINLEQIKNQLELEKKGREKDIEISNIKQRFFVNISHEIRTPLTLIFGEIDQLGMKSGGSKFVAESIRNLRNSGNHLMQLVNELLDFRRLEKGGIQIKVGQENFVDFCKEIYLSFTSKAEAQNIHFDFSSEQAVIDLWYDSDQLEKVFFNLISNAFKNTPVGGTIRFIINLSVDGVEAVIEDTGHGIPKKELDDVFERFYQKDNTPDISRQGFGIGLSIVKEIVKLHKGDIMVESEVGKGSRFIVCLRSGNDHFDEESLMSNLGNSETVTEYSIADVEIPETEQDFSKKEEILIVEDNFEIRKFLVRTLSQRFRVLEASNGKEAYKLLEDQSPDLIISDVLMPEMNGISLTRLVKRNPITSHIPIILLTARTGSVFKREGFENGADDYITKPFNSATLLVRINNILKARKALADHIRNEIATRPIDLNLATPDEQFLKKLVQILDRNLDNSELDAETISMEMGMSHSVVYKKLKALTGFNLVEFVRDYRLQQASEILAKYKFTVSETCFEVGFSDKKYFSQIFKKKFGVSPSEYAKKYQ